MIQPLPIEILRFRKAFLASICRFFDDRGYLEVETPALNPTGAVEPFIDSFRVQRTGPRKSPEAGSDRPLYLITSPEYNLKVLVAHLGRPIYEVGHVFRSGDVGREHTEEFLMLEWYRPGADESDLMEETQALFLALAAEFPLPQGLQVGPSARKSVSELFADAGCESLSGEALLRFARKNGLGGDSDRYDELFFSIFLNRIEPGLKTESPLYVTGYPAELAALSTIQGGTARRFEVYWKGIELANGYEELHGRKEHELRFAEFNRLREETSRPPMEADPQFLHAADHLPPCSGIALGVERLMMVFLGAESLAEVSPFAWSKLESADIG